MPAGSLSSTNLAALNLNSLLVFAVLVIVFYLTYTLTAKSLKNLKTEVFSFYPFDLFFPKGGSWAVGYFIVSIALFGLLIVLLAKGQFYLKPA